ncbi:MAG: dihydropteroate synthase [Actinomycetota bacterium]|jgi:dihydropteroate synthase|nr:dihydropteroate synthase [Actinomycetota bacterium]
MGVVNVTPDSFSDGGMWFTPTAAVAHGLDLLEQGADILDVGGESTRPGAERPSEEEELHRVIPVIRELSRSGARVSVDTMRSSVAEQAVEAGAAIVNDVSGGLADPQMARIVASAGVPFVVMHWRGHSDTMQAHVTYDDVVADVCRALSERVADLRAQGVHRDQLILDPGFGFAKLAEHNWSLLAHLDALQALGLPVLVGTSRKTFLGALGVLDGQAPRPPFERDVSTAATTVIAGLAGVWGVRVHDVASSVEALRVVAALEAAR